MQPGANEAAGMLVRRPHLYSRRQALGRLSPLPAAGGVYGWWSRQLPPLVQAGGCARHDGMTLLYVGISPSRPPRAAGRQAGRTCGPGS